MTKRTLRIPLLAALLIALAVGRGTCQPSERSASYLVKFLTYQSSDRPRTQFSVGCGLWNTDRAAARSLAELGSSAVPEIEQALDSIERRGQASEFAVNSGWLLIAYARIEGAAALPRLRALMAPRFGFVAVDLGYSIALSLGLTSYVSSLVRPLPIVHCGRLEESRYALDQLILGWERDDRPWLEASLGPNARDGLKTLLAGRTWGAMRATLWHGKSEVVATGYRFDAPGGWSDPPEALGAESEHRDVSHPTNPELGAMFKDSSGEDCGRYRLRFVRDGQGLFSRYLIDNADLGELLQLIGSCAAK